MLKKYFLKTYSLALLIIILISSCNLDEFDFDNGKFLGKGAFGLVKKCKNFLSFF